MKGYSEIFQLISKPISKFTSSCLQSSTFAALIYFRTFALDFLLKRGHLRESTFVGLNYLKFCKKYGAGPMYFGLFFKSHLEANSFQDDEDELDFKFLLPTLSKCLKYGLEYVREFFNILFFSLNEASEDFIPADYLFGAMTLNNQIMEMYLDELKYDKSFSKHVLTFAFVMGYEKEFKQLLEQYEWNDEELCQLLVQSNRMRFSNQFQNNLNLLFNRLNPNAKINSGIAIQLLKSLNRMNNLKFFDFVWNHKHLEKTRSEVANEITLIFADYQTNRNEWLKLVLPYCSFDSNQDFQTECWLKSVANYGILSEELEVRNKLLNLKWSEELLLKSMKSIRHLERIHTFWKSPLIEDSLWTEQTVHALLLRCVQEFSETIVEDLYEQFSDKIEISKENYNQLRRFFYDYYIYFRQTELFERSENLKFKSEKQREIFCEFAKDLLISPEIIEKIRKIPLYLN